MKEKLACCACESLEVSFLGEAADELFDCCSSRSGTVSGFKRPTSSGLKHFKRHECVVYDVMHRLYVVYAINVSYERQKRPGRRPFKVSFEDRTGSGVGGRVQDHPEGRASARR